MEQLNSKDRYDLNRQKKLQTQEASTRQRKSKKAIFRSLIGLLVVLPIAGLIWYAVTRPSTPESEIVSRSGFHWHPELTIYVKGEEQEIPENIGIGAVHQPIHTHDDSGQGIVHMEFQGMARRQDVALGQFFKNWGKDIRSFGANMKMTVNGEENMEYENYVMRDKDKIELRFD